MAKKILVVEDEADLVKLLEYNLAKEGYEVVTALDGEAGLASFRATVPDLILLDVMLPKMDGFELCKLIRQDSQVPIIMLTARKEEVDRIVGLELGADDYVLKPFSIRELLARVKAVLRRGGGGSALRRVVTVGPLTVDLAKYEVRLAGEVVPLSAKEFELLKLLLLAEGRALSRDAVLEAVWGYERSMEIDTRTVDQHVARLRSKLGGSAARIITVKGMGYRFQFDD